MSAENILVGCPFCGSLQLIFEDCEEQTIGFFAFQEGPGDLFHAHDPNRYRMRIKCRNDHRWTEDRYRACWCGWKKKKDEFSFCGEGQEAKK